MALYLVGISAGECTISGRYISSRIPFCWSAPRLLVRTQTAGPHPDCWSAPRLLVRNQVMLLDSARDMLAVALIAQGQSVNSQKTSVLKRAEKKLQKLSPNVKAVVADEMKLYLEQGEAAIGVAYSGDAAEMMAANSHLHYVVPSEGSNIWYDSFVIPKAAKNVKAAYAFINFMLEPKNAAQNARYVGYATPNRVAKRYLSKKVTSNRAFYPNAKTMRHLQVYQDLPKRVNQTYNDLFLKFKMFVN